MADDDDIGGETLARELETLLELIDVYERGISRLPGVSELRGSLERALPYLQIAAGQPPEPPVPAQHQRQLSLLVRPA